MGDEKSVINKMGVGQLQGAGFSGQGTVLLCPEFAVMELPFLFNNWAEVDYIKDKMTETMDVYMAKKGVKLLLWNDQDFDQIYSVKYKFDSLDQFPKAKFFTWYGTVEEAVFRRLGTSPIVVDVPEAPTAVRQGIADSAIGPSLFMIGAQMYSVIRYVNPVKIRYSPSPIVVTLAAWKSLPKVFADAFAKDRYRLVKEYCARTRVDGDKGIAAMLKYGVQMVKMKPEVEAEMRKRTRPVWDELAGKLYPRQLLDEVMRNLADYRAGRRS